MLRATDVLAGPILRRVEPNLISVWVALTMPAKVEIEVFRGQGPAGTLGPAVPRNAPASPLDLHTIAAGAKLHVVVSMWEPASLAGLELGQIFSYDLLIVADDGSTARLKDLGLLQDHAEAPKWLALGYNQDWLPSFAVVPEKVTDLKVAQGSCRASAGQGRDGLPPLDDFIRAGLTDPKKRLHMLFLTGDQIYADEVEAQQLEMLQTVANELIGGDKASAAETIAVEFKATDTEPAATVHYPVDAAHIPPGRRGHLLNDLAGFTSTSTDSHVIGFGEYCALYLTGWSTVNWGDWKPRELLAARKAPFERYVLETGRGHKKLKTFIELHPDKDGDVFEAMVRYHDAWRLVPKKFRAIDTMLSAQDRKAAWGHGEKGADGTNFFAWAEAWGPDPDNPPVPETDETAADMPASPRTNAELNRLARALTPSWFAGAHYFGVNYEVTEELVNPGVLKLKTKSDGVYNRVHRLEWFFRDVPRVRRLLANVPTYMVFDDHEITDDWNISPKWARQTRGNALGRAVIRNGLAACTLCQNWGNDPRAFRPGTMGRRVLDQIVAMFAGATPASPGPKTAAAEALERLFDLKPPTPNAERMTWHFRYEGPGFEVISLDSRTWRGFEPEGNESIRPRFSEEATATLLTDEAMRLQVPEQPPVGVNPDGVCLVIAAAPFIGYPVVESIVQPLMNLRDIAQSEKPEPPFLRWKKSFAVGRLARDPENWGFTPSLFEAMLARLSSRRRVLFLSGDVHYAFTLSMAYWKMGPNWAPGEATRFVQLTASSFRAQRQDLAPLVAIELAQQLGGLSSELHRYGWKRGPVGSPTFDPPVVQGEAFFNSHLQLLLLEDPIVISPQAVPADASYVRGPEWAYQTALVPDRRRDEERLAVLHPPPFNAASQIELVRSVADRHVWQSQNAMPRGWQWWTNFSVVEFTAAPDGKPAAVRHRIFGYDPQGLEPVMTPFIEAEVPLDVTEPPPLPPAPEPFPVIIKRASVTTLKVLKAAALVTLETLEVLVDILTDPAKAYTYCDKVGVPPFTPSTEWKPAVTRLREKADVAKTPEDWAEITSLAIKIIGGIHDAISNPNAPGPGKVEAAFTKIVVPALLYAIPKAHFPGNVLVYAILAGAYFTDQRLQDSYPQGLFAERWGAMLGDLAVQAGWGRRKEGEEAEEGLDADWGPIASDALALACVILALVLENESFKRRLIRFWYGFDHPDIPELPEARRLAQHAFTLLLNVGEQKIEAADFDKPLRDQPPEEPPAPLALTLVPVPATETTPSKLYVQVRGQADINEELGAGFKLRLTNGASFGVLASRDGLEPTGNVSFQAELLREEPVQAAHEPEKGNVLEFRVVKLGVGARVSVDEIAAWVRVQQGELAISGGTWLDDFVPRLKFTFDLTAEASVLNGVRFKGGAGGDVLIPINQKIPILIGNARLEAVRIKALLGDVGGEMTFGLQVAAQLTLELFKILKVHVSGIGAAYHAGMAKEGEGNIAGVAKMGWTPVLPTGAGIELKVWKIEGGGALFYDAAKERLSGALVLHFAKKFSLTGLGIYQRAIAGGPRSWLVVVSMELPQSGPGFQFAGLGLLYGSNRSTSPEAFLAGLTTGDLDAVLFPDDPVGHAPQYLAALERLFPAKENSTVLGISAKFTALGGRLRLDLGVIIEGSDLARMYIVAQFVGLLKKPKPGERLDPLSQPVRVLADGVAIWDSQTDELNLRIMLRNSRVWAGELTGGASLFHGSPQTDGQDHGTYISVGGFHPDYVPPGTKIFVPPRLSLVLSKGDHLKLEMRAYVAFTPSSLQFGAMGSLEARLYGFGIRGRLSLDVLIGFDGTFNLKIEFSVELLLGSKSIAAVRFVGTIEGFTPTVLSGKVEVKFLFWTLSKHGSNALYEGDAPEESVNVQESLAAAVADAANWNSGGAPGLALTDRDRDGVWLSPTEPLRFQQPVVPLNVPIERFGAVKLPGAITLRIERVSTGPAELRTNPLAGEFALGMFLNLTQEEMLASRGFETRDAGVELERALDNGDAVTTSAGFEEILLDPLKRPEEPAPMTVVLGNLNVFDLDTVRPMTPVKIRRERFAVVDEGLQLQGGARGFFEARAALRSGLRIVPEAEVLA